MKVLVLGARGMLGSMLCSVFSDVGPVYWDREELDIAKEQLVREKIVGLAPDVIINAAAYTDVDGAETHQDFARAINGEAVGFLARAAKEIDATLVHFSTDYVFAGDKKNGIRENDVPGTPVNAYGVSKLLGERLLQETQPRYYLVRTAWLYGPGGKNFVETMLRLGKTGKELPVVNDQHGSPTYTKDLALATRELIDGGYALGIYHLTNSGQATWYSYAQEIFKAEGRKVAVRAVTSDQFVRPAKRPSYSVLLNTKGPRLRPWQNALHEYIESRAQVMGLGASS